MVQLFARGNLWSKLFTIHVERSDTIKKLKQKIVEKLSVRVPYPLIRITRMDGCGYSSMLMDNTVTMSMIGIREYSFVHFSLIMAGIAIQIDDNEYIEDPFPPEYDEGFNQYKHRIIATLKEDSNNFDDQYKILWNGEEFIMDDKKFKPPTERHMIEQYGGRAIWRNNASQILQIKTRDKELWFEENKRKIYDEKCVLLVYGFIRTDIEKLSTLNIPIAIKQICKLYYHK